MEMVPGARGNSPSGTRILLIIFLQVSLFSVSPFLDADYRMYLDRVSLAFNVIYHIAFAFKITVFSNCDWITMINAFSIAIRLK